MLSIIIPKFSEPGFLDKCLESIRENSDSIEIIVCNEESNDDTGFITAEYNALFISSPAS
ncbi:MAG: glycosyltransferase [Salibacteraceae bacterium]|nr:glycosyltransferase [Salibacteraceae bacterium]